MKMTALLLAVTLLFTGCVKVSCGKDGTTSPASTAVTTMSPETTSETTKTLPESSATRAPETAPAPSRENEHDNFSAYTARDPAGTTPAATEATTVSETSPETSPTVPTTAAAPETTTTTTEASATAPPYSYSLPSGMTALEDYTGVWTVPEPPATSAYEAMAGAVTTSREPLPPPEEGRVIAYPQKPEWPTGCESVALFILLRCYGLDVSVRDIVDSLPREPIPWYVGETRYGGNPERGFMGEPSDPNSYGVYNQPIASAANRFKAGAVAENGCTTDRVREILETGTPLIAWISMYPAKDPKISFWYDYLTGKAVTWVGGEHAVVVFGLSEDGGFIYSDPLTGFIGIMNNTYLRIGLERYGGRIVYYPGGSFDSILPTEKEVRDIIEASKKAAEEAAEQPDGR